MFGYDHEEYLKDKLLSNDGFGMGLHGDWADEALANFTSVISEAKESGEAIREISFEELIRRINER